MNAPNHPSTLAEPRLTSLSHGGGCKIAPGRLCEILKGCEAWP